MLTHKRHYGLFPMPMGSFGVQTTVHGHNFISIRHLRFLTIYISEFLKFVGPIEPRGQKIMRSANNVGNAGPHIRQIFLNDVFTFLTEVGNAGRIVTTGTSSEFVTALNT
jgi:hypothetical protein